TVPVAATRAGRPPADCAVAHPDMEQCSTGGSWSGELTLSTLTSTPARAAAASAAVRPNGVYSGATSSRRRIDLRVSQGSVSIVAFAFYCAGAVARTSLS